MRGSGEGDLEPLGADGGREGERRNDGDRRRQHDGRGPPGECLRKRAGERREGA